MKTKLTDEEIAAFRAQHTEATRSNRIAQLEQLRLEASALEMHVDAPPGQVFDVWGDGALKAPADCTPPPDAPPKK